MHVSSNRQAGFSLIELLVVLVIIGLLAGLVVPNIMGKAGKAKHDAAKAQVQALGSAIDAYYLDTGSPPNELRDLVQKPSGASFWNGPYARDSQLVDPWNQAYEYRFPGENAQYDLISYGEDQRPGGEGVNEDITNY
jgi:general secretion pathway protein G